jgi:Transposase DDE domain
MPRDVVGLPPADLSYAAALAGFNGDGLRKQTPEPVFGIIKSVMGFRQFLLRGLDCVRGEWSLVTWNIKRIYALSLS